uniref:Uncharacterized protein n=1 Tax=Kalanchoe fedtschenkoi TaxID=63787 RepID=A0A7N0UI90_KALFE
MKDGGRTSLQMGIKHHQEKDHQPYGGNGGGLSIPPGPPSFLIVTAFSWMRKSFSQIEPTLRSLRSKSRVTVFISDHKLAHKALIQNGAICSNRPTSSPAAKLINTNQKNISSAFYVRSYSAVRKWILDILIRSLEQDAAAIAGIMAVDHLQYAMFCLLVFMCFGDKVSNEQIKRVDSVHRDFIIKTSQSDVLNFLPDNPTLGKFVFRKGWVELYRIRAEQEQVLIPSSEHAQNKKPNQGPRIAKCFHMWTHSSWDAVALTILIMTSSTVSKDKLLLLLLLPLRTN